MVSSLETWKKVIHEITYPLSADGEMSFNQAVEGSRELAQLVRAEYNPDIVVSIANGGLLPGIEISNHLETPNFPIIIGKGINLGNLYKTIPEPLRKLADIYDVYLYFTTDTRLIKGAQTPRSQRVLLVDDMVHTGATMQIARDYMEGFNPVEVKTATLHYVDEETAPDFYLERGRCSFPWSKNSPEYHRWQTYLQRNKKSFI